MEWNKDGIINIKGTMSPQAHAHVDEKLFEFAISWPNFFKYRRRVQEAVFICLNRVHLWKGS